MAQRLCSPICLILAFSCVLASREAQIRDQSEGLQAKARLSSCQHADSVLLWQGYAQSANASSANATQEAALDGFEAQLRQSIRAFEFAPKGVPSNQQIVDCIALYSDIYAEVNGGQGSGIATPSADNGTAITSAIGLMMRRTSTLQASLEAQS